MPLNPLFEFAQLPTTSAAAIREFQDRYLAVIGASQPTGWADTLGELIPTDRPDVTFPVSQLRTFYRRTEGESRFKKLREAFFRVQTEEFDDGYQARLKDLFLEVFAYRNWQRAPERFVLAEEQHRHVQVATLLDGSGTRGGTTRNGTVGSANDPGGVGRTCLDGTNFFGTTHPINFVDPSVVMQTTGASTWSNYQTTAKNVLGSTASANTGTFSLDNLQAEVIAMQNGVPDENGFLIGARPDTIIVPTDYEEPLTNFMASQRVLASIASATTPFNPAAAATDQFYHGKFNIVGAKEFTQKIGSTADWYLVDSKMLKQGIMPWVILRETVPQSLALRVFDESSDFFKETGDIKLSSHIWYGFGLALPHAIRCVKGPTR
jgi:hypothetical protein